MDFLRGVFREKGKGRCFFAVGLFDFIADSEVDCWIYGHHHVNSPEFNIKKTKMLTNQLG
jgi:hypothetical protein